MKSIFNIVQYFTISTSIDFLTFLWLKDRNVLALFHLGSAARNLTIARINFTDDTFSWNKQLDWPTNPWTIGQSNAVYESNTGIVYISLLNSSNFELLIIDGVDGSLLNIFIAENFNEIPDSYLYNSQTVYTSAKSNIDSLNYIFAYQISNNSFTQLVKKRHCLVADFLLEQS